MEIIVGILLAVGLVIGFIYWYIESKISQAKEVASMAITGVKLGKELYDDHKKNK